MTNNQFENGKLQMKSWTKEKGEEKEKGKKDENGKRMKSLK